MNSKNCDRNRKLLWILLIPLLLSCAWYANVSYEMMSNGYKTLIPTSVEQSRFLIYVACIILMTLCAVTPLPAELIAVGNAALFSSFEAVMLTWISAIIGASIAYELGRIGVIDTERLKAKNRIVERLHRHRYHTLMLMRLLPVVPFFALNLSSGLLRLDRKKYLAITAIGILPGVSAMCLIPEYILGNL